MARDELQRERDSLLQRLEELDSTVPEVEPSREQRARERTGDLEASLARLYELEGRYTLALRGTHDGIWDWDLRSGRIYFSGRWKEMLGYAADEIGDDPRDWLGRVHRDDIDGLRADIDRHVQRLSPRFENEHRVRCGDGEFRWVLARGIAVWDDNGRAVRMAGAQTAITGLGVRDRVTGLPNRLLFLDRLDGAIRRADRHEGALFGALFVDLDRLQRINDGLGRAWGDRLLHEVGERLRVQLRLADTVACLGGDQFAVVLEEMRSVADALRVAERVHIWIRRPFQLASREISVSASIGVAVSATAYDDAAQMLHDAEEAMRSAKNEGGGCTRVFDKTMSKLAADRLQLEVDLEGAIDHDQLRVFMQPLVSLATRRISGFEALARWERQETVFVPPVVFIPVAEETDLIVPIGRWILFESLRLVRDLEARFGRDQVPSVNVNVSARQLERYSFVDNVADALREFGLSPDRLHVEITETALFNEVEKSLGVLASLKEMGVQIVLDDFGTGYSSLAYLARFPVDALKIDRSFVDALGAGDDAKRLVQAIIDIAHGLGISVTAEGIETTDQLALLDSMACDCGQGYLFAKPQSHAAIEALLERGPTFAY